MADLTFHKLSWQDLEKDCIALSKKMKNVKIDWIIAVSRGGLAVSRMMSDFLSVPISHITIASYENAKQVKEPIITEPPVRDFKEEVVLILDDVSDTGRTFQTALDYFKKLPVKKIYTASPYVKPHTQFTPDFWEKNIDAWICFPYEVRDTKDAFVKMLGTQEKAKEKMKEVGFENWEIQGVFD